MLWSMAQGVLAEELSLEKVIAIAHRRSYSAQSARFKFVAAYWSYRSFKAELMPSVNISGSLMNFDHSKVETRNSETGWINYVDNNSLTNSLTLSVDQHIPGLGGTVSVQSYLYRLDQFDYNQRTYNTQPLRITYNQPLRSYNNLNWQRKTAPVEFERAKKQYLENMEQVTISASQLFFGAISAQSNYKQSQKNYADLQTMYEMAKKRYAIGTINKSEMLQLELSLLNAKVNVTNNKINLDNRMFNLFSYLRLSGYDDVELIVPENMPDVVVDVAKAIDYALENSSHVNEQNLVQLEARRALAQAKSQRGIQLQLRSELGFTKTADNLSSAYGKLKDNEKIGLTLSLPVFDWGVSKGKVRVAKANLEMAKILVEQQREEYVQEVRKQVVQFACQLEQCQTAMRARDISTERYELTKRRFEEGTVTVTDLNTALQEAEKAKTQYVYQLETYWTEYFILRRTTLYDWQRACKLTADYDNLLNSRYDE